MITIRDSVPLAPFTTFHIGGPARAYCQVQSDEEIDDAIAYANAHGLALRVLGAGSNVLVPDEGVDALVLHMHMNDMVFTEESDRVICVAGAGAKWDDVVDAACARGLSGIENLAGIPGTLGGAAVQNIGAYGAEFSSAFLYADVVDSFSSEKSRIGKGYAEFGYRRSMFKHRADLIIVRVALALLKHAPLQVEYADLAKAASSGSPLTTSAEVAQAVRSIRAEKFPSHAREGTAGSFFKNPIISETEAASLVERFPGLPAFPQPGGKVKIPLAWILDHALSLKGYAKGPVRLYEKQPLVIVASPGARATDVDALAADVQHRVYEATGITIEREVETMNRAILTDSALVSEMIVT